MRITALGMVGALSACCALGCEWCERRKFEDDLEQRCARADARVGQVDLVESVTGELKPVRPGLRIIVTPTAISVDNTSLVADWWRSSQERDPDALFPDMEPVTPREWGELDDLVVDAENVARIRDGRFSPADLRDPPDGLLIKPLYEVLKKAVRTSKIRCVRTNCDFDARINVYADRSTSYETLVKVLYTAGQAECERFGYVVEHDSRPVELEISHAKCTPACGTRSRDSNEPLCLSPLLTIRESGVTAHVERLEKGRQPAWVQARMEHLMKLVSQRLAADAGPADESETPTVDEWRPAGEWHGSVIAGRNGGCPSVGRLDGRIDFGALEQMYAELARRVPPCTGAHLRVARDVSWEDVAGVLEVTRVRGGYGYVSPDGQLVEVKDPAECERVVTPAQIRVDSGS